ncbi:hypothetical protein [Pantoea sp. ME81]|uniref:hypothetical protein n=1 Tax=Pantoea sp. ME81 TaxID=2743935 RepID=UPI0015F487C6|nr:hypothetical protein [Pantoea sp. ME81]
MFSKVWKVFKEVSIGILLVLSLWLVVNGALKKSEGHFEFGNLMDFFNTIGTIATAFIAMYAIKQAPNWINQKKNEDSYTLVKELILDDYYKLNSHWTGVSALALYLESNIELISDDVSYFCTVDECNTNLEKIRDRTITPALLKHKLKKLTKLNCTLEPEIIQYHEKILLAYTSVFKSNMMIWTGIKRTLTKADLEVEEYDEFLATLKKQIKRVEDGMKIMSQNYKNIENFSDDLSNYFSIKVSK